MESPADRSRGLQAPVLALGYSVPHGVHDEAVGPDGGARAHWAHLLDALGKLGPQELAERRRKAHRILRDDGATYTVYGEHMGADQAWPLDPVPLLVESEEWRHLELGLVERAELLDLLLKDVYGPRELLRHKVIPPEAVFGYPGFLRPCVGIPLRGENFLQLHATDLARDAEGQFWALGDRTQAPSGAGYALENRMVMSRVLPSLFRDSHVHRLAFYFRALRRAIARAAPASDSEPNVVILTPGPYSESYFEHAYLANYLGYRLVQGADLMFRDGAIWVGSVGGYDRVDVIIRRMDDYYCDPVELKGDSRLGVPGLLEAVRGGRVALANPLGAGVAENPVLLKYWDAIAEHFLGRRSYIPSVRTWWCGDPADRRYVLAHLDRLVVKPVFRSRDESPILAAALSREQQRELGARIEARPNRFVAQVRVVKSITPTWTSTGLSPHPAVLRGFTVAGDAGYVCMPGGLTRVSRSESDSLVDGSHDVINKDTWVLASEPERPAPAAQASAAQLAWGRAGSLPSRVVENLYWMSRYAERSVFSVRLLRTVFMLANQNLGPWELASARPRRILLEAITHTTATYPGFSGPEPGCDPEDPQAELVAITLDLDRPGSVRSNLHAMLRAAREVQEELSGDTQRVINDIADALPQLETALKRNLGSAPEEAFGPLVTSLMGLGALIDESMLHGYGWRFAAIGRRLERALLLTTLLRATAYQAGSPGDEAALLAAVLLSSEMLITYRRRYRGEVTTANALELMLFTRSNPRSLEYQLAALGEHVERLIPISDDAPLPVIARSVREAHSLVELADRTKLFDVDTGSGNRESLHQFLSRLHHLLSQTGVEITNAYFDHSRSPQELVRSQWSTEP